MIIPATYFYLLVSKVLTLSPPQILSHSAHALQCCYCRNKTWPLTSFPHKHEKCKNVRLYTLQVQNEPSRQILLNMFIVLSGGDPECWYTTNLSYTSHTNLESKVQYQIPDSYRIHLLSYRSISFWLHLCASVWTKLANRNNYHNGRIWSGTRTWMMHRTQISGENLLSILTLIQYNLLCAESQKDSLCERKLPSVCERERQIHR